MELKEYIEGTRRTWNDKEDHKNQFVNAVLGLSEINELRQNLSDNTKTVTDIIDELGDLTYYYARCIDLVCEEFYPKFILNIQYSDVCSEIFNLQEIAKKYRFHNKDLEWFKTKYSNTLYALNIIASYINKICVNWAINIGDVYQYNLDKLAQRHPNGFNGNGY